MYTLSHRVRCLCCEPIMLLCHAATCTALHHPFTLGADATGSSSARNTSDCLLLCLSKKLRRSPNRTERARKAASFFANCGALRFFAVAYLASYGIARFFAQRTGTRLWLPDAVLLCTLLMVPRKKWWLYVLDEHADSVCSPPCARRLAPGFYG